MFKFDRKDYANLKKITTYTQFKMCVYILYKTKLKILVFFIFFRYIY